MIKKNGISLILIAFYIYLNSFYLLIYNEPFDFYNLLFSNIFDYCKNIIENKFKNEITKSYSHLLNFFVKVYKQKKRYIKK